eukprot:6234292-Pyramimonas_sp.AAC.1
MTINCLKKQTNPRGEPGETLGPLSERLGTGGPQGSGAERSSISRTAAPTGLSGTRRRQHAVRVRKRALRYAFARRESRVSRAESAGPPSAHTAQHVHTRQCEGGRVAAAYANDQHSRPRVIRRLLGCKHVSGVLSAPLPLSAWEDL